MSNPTRDPKLACRSRRGVFRGADSHSYVAQRQVDVVPALKKRELSASFLSY